MSMIWYQLDENAVLEAAKNQFPSKYINYDTCDLYLKNLEKGTIRFSNIDQNFFVSTHYVYEERLVKGNQTRYKVAIPLLTVKNNPYDIVYDVADCTYCVYKENDTYQFILYTEFLDKIETLYEIIA
jgi:hypothetical protein